MGRGKHKRKSLLSNEEIIGRHEAGDSYKTLTLESGLPLTAVMEIIKKVVNKELFWADEVRRLYLEGLSFQEAFQKANGMR